MRNGWLWGVCGVALLAAGCASVMLPAGPDIYSMPRRPNAATIVVAKPMDPRGNKTQLGRISATSLSMKADPTELVGKEVVAALYEQGINGTLGHVSSRDTASFARVAADSQAQGVLAVDVQALTISSVDALLDPPTATATLHGTLYDRNGNELGAATVTGTVQRRINAFALEKSAGQLVSEAMHDAARRLVVHGEITGSMSKVASVSQQKEE